MRYTSKHSMHGKLGKANPTGTFHPLSYYSYILLFSFFYYYGSIQQLILEVYELWQVHPLHEEIYLKAQNPLH